MKNKKKIIIISISTIAIVLMITLAIILNKNTNGDRVIQSTKNSLEEYQENETKDLNLGEKNDNLENAVDNYELTGNANGEIKQNIQENQQEVDSKQNKQVDKQTSTTQTQTKVKSTTSNNQQRQQILQNKQKKIQSNTQTKKTDSSSSNLQAIQSQTTTQKQTQTDSKNATADTKVNNEKQHEEYHKKSVGNTGKWFNTKAEAEAYYDKISKEWSTKWEKFEIDDETYSKNAPSGFEDWSCPICHKWTINFYYR